MRLNCLLSDWCKAAAVQTKTTLQFGLSSVIIVMDFLFDILSCTCTTKIILMKRCEWTGRFKKYIYISRQWIKIVFPSQQKKTKTGNLEHLLIAFTFFFFASYCKSTKTLCTAYELKLSLMFLVLMMTIN